MNRCRFVEDHQRRVRRRGLCPLREIARSSFSCGRRTAVARAARQEAGAGLATWIRKAQQDSDAAYGAPRITAELRAEGGLVVHHKRAARTMRAIGIEGVRLRRRHRTALCDRAAAKAPDLNGRDVTAAETNTQYVGDSTYLSVGGPKFCHLATVIGLCWRPLAGQASPIAGAANASSAPWPWPGGPAGVWPAR